MSIIRVILSHLHTSLLSFVWQFLILRLPATLSVAESRDPGSWDRWCSGRFRFLLTKIKQWSQIPLCNIQHQIDYDGGSLCFLWIFMWFLPRLLECAFIIYTSRQQKEKNAKLITNLFVQKAGFDKEGSTDLVKKYNRLTMATSECMARMAAATLKMLGEDEDVMVTRG